MKEILLPIDLSHHGATQLKLPKRCTKKNVKKYYNAQSEFTYVTLVNISSSIYMIDKQPL